MNRALLFIAALMLSSPALAQRPAVSLFTPMVADASQDTVEIHSSFNGTQLLVFGARNQSGDLVIAVRGPDANVVLRRKERIAGMWMHVEQEKYFHLPLFYGIAATRPLEQIAPPETLLALELGTSQVVRTSNARSSVLFDDALEKYLGRYRLWQSPFAPITFFSESLFKARINLPDRLPRWHFTVEVYLFDRGQLIAMQSLPLVTYKTGFDARVYDTAQKKPFLYGITAILMALAGGWLAHRLFNRR
jgi:uncharacterized protein (TIGR02186 family)